MNTTKYLTFIVFLLISIGCGPKDKKQQLTQLKNQREELNKKIEALELEISNDTTLTNGRKEKVTQVGITEISQQQFVHYIDVQGTLDGEQNVAAMAEVPAPVTIINVKVGENVRKGQTLAQLDASVLYQTLKELETSAVFINDLYERQKNLWEQKIGSEVQYLTAKNNKEALELKTKTLKDQIDMYRIKSPIDGRVEEINLKIGQIVSPGYPLIRVVNFSMVKIVAEISENYAIKVKKGDKVQIKFPAIETELDAEISFTSKYINPLNRTFTIESHFSPKGVEYRVNMIANMKIKDYTNNQAIVVPINVIQSEKDKNFIYVAENNGNKWVAAKKYIKKGMEYNGQLEVIEGLNIGDKLISIGFQDLTIGETISF